MSESDRICSLCLLPLPAGSNGNLRYHPDCRREMRMKPGGGDRDCQYCGKPLPADSNRKRLYHVDCAKAVDLDRKRGGSAVYWKKHKNKKVSKPAPLRNPMLNTGDDYWILKLAGLIHIPPAHGKQINLDVW